MINISNELHFLILNIRSYISFKIKCFFFFLIYGHYFRNKNFKKHIRKNKILKIHFGSTDEIDGFFNSQVIGKNPINIAKKLPINDNSISTIFSSHVIEHLHKKEIIFFLNESYRILAKGGINIILTPSLSKISKILYSENDEENKKILLTRLKKWSKEEFNACEYVNGVFRNYGHRFILDYDFVKYQATKIGYKNAILGDVNSIPDKLVKDFIVKKRNDHAWLLETDFYFLIK
tara:strand:+ start:1402 stop:2103 length:702 start_codon:yes stop_codon:yes gene_type:complete